MAGERVKVADFGISRLENSNLTQDAAMLGTPSYMAPEQCRGAAVDARTDLFSVGVVLFEMLAGVKPFAGSGVAEVFAKLLHAPAPDLAVSCPALPPGVCAVVARSLEKAPGDRFGSAEAMAAALRAAVSMEADATVVARGVPKGPVSEAEITVLERALAAYLGPVARILIRRARVRAGSVTELWHAVAMHIEDEEERAAFLRGR